MPKHPVERRAAYPFHTPIQVRWGDLDPFLHVNNVVYYRYFEGIILQFLAQRAGLDLLSSPVLTFAAESRCVFNKPLDLSDVGPTGVMIDGGFRVDSLGRSSVTYGLGLFRPGEDDAAAQGTWVHVFVDRATARPVPIPDSVRAAFAAVCPRGEAGDAPGDAAGSTA